MFTNKKVILIGDTGVGKTSILQRYFNQTFDENLKTTCFVTFKSKEVGDLKLNIWDTAG